MMDKPRAACYTPDRSMMKRFLALFAAAGVLAAGCSPPKYVNYKSVNGDFATTVPWGWQIFTDQEADGKGFAQTVFIGPFDPQFYLGVPSVTVRWYRSFWPHTLRDGRIESYAGPDDFIKRTLSDVYGPKYTLEKPVTSIDLRQSGLQAQFFVVFSPVAVPKETRNGVEEDPETGKTFNVRRHGYVVVPMGEGFYVITYPATRLGYPKNDENFNQIVSAFRPFTRGPGGHKVRIPGPGKSGSAIDG